MVLPRGEADNGQDCYPYISTGGGSASTPFPSLSNFSLSIIRAGVSCFQKGDGSAEMYQQGLASGEFWHARGPIIVLQLYPNAPAVLRFRRIPLTRMNLIFS